MENKQPVQPTGDTYSYKGWMNSDSFLKRAFGTWGHVLVAQIIVVVPFYILMIIVALVVGSILYSN